MRNLKKALSLALALVMLLGMMMVGAGAAEIKDIDSVKADNQEAVKVMNALTILVGDENGNFNPDNTLTRAEAAVIISKVHLTPALVAKLGAAETRFVDVAAYDDGWASRYVEACAVEQIILGDDDTHFGPERKVSGAEFAAMLLRVLGIDNGQFKNWPFDWQKAALQAGLDANGVDVFAEELSRAQAAQMAFNALTYSPSGEKTYKVGDETFSSAAEAYFYSQANGEKIEVVTAKDSLAAIRFNLSEGTQNDSFGRTVKIWSVDGEKVYTGTTAIGAAPSWTSKPSNMNALNGYTFADDAVKIEDGKSSDIAGDAKTEIGKLVGNGTSVDVYASNKVISKVVVIKEYVGTVSAVTEARGNAKRTVTVEGKRFETEDFAVNDVVIYTKANDSIKTMALAEMIEDVEITKTVGDKGTTSFTAGGEVYTYGASLAAANGDAYISTQNRVDLYLDSYGYVVKVELNEGVSAYAYVIDIGMDATRYTSDNTFYAKLLLTDGTVIEGKLSKADYASTKDKVETNDEKIGELKDEFVTLFKSKIVEFTKNSKDVYKLDNTVTSSAKQDSKDITIETGEAAMTLEDATDADDAPATYYADNKTIFLVKTGNNSYTVYNGYNEVPNLSATNGTHVVAATGSVADVVYLEGVTARSKDIVFVLKPERDPQPIKVSDSVKYYEYSAVVNGEIVTVKLDDVIEANALYSAITYVDPVNEVIDKDGSTPYASSGSIVVSGNVTKALTNGNLAIAGTSYRVADDVQVFVCGNNISESSVSSIVSTDTLKDVVLKAVVTKGKLVAVFYEVGKEAKAPTTTTPAEGTYAELVKAEIGVDENGDDSVIFLANLTEGAAADVTTAQKTTALIKAVAEKNKVSGDDVTVEKKGVEWKVTVGKITITYTEEDTVVTNVVKPDKNQQLNDIKDSDLSTELTTKYNDLVNNYVDQNARIETVLKDDGKAVVKVTPSKWTTVADDTTVPTFGTGKLVETYTDLSGKMAGDNALEYAIVCVTDMTDNGGEPLSIFKIIFKATDKSGKPAVVTYWGVVQDGVALEQLDDAGASLTTCWYADEDGIYYTPVTPGG